MFAVDHSSVEPDRWPTGKSMASGSDKALVARKELFPRFCLLDAPAICERAAGLATMKIIERDRLPERAAALGLKMKRRLEEVMERHPLVGDVRGKGLFVGLELVSDRKTKKPARGSRPRRSSTGHGSSVCLPSWGHQSKVPSSSRPPSP